MNCQPFDDWLLNDKKLSNEEKRELDSHLRICRHCAAISEAGFALRAARVISPAPGFVARFEKRLASQKIAERRRRLWGAVILVFTGMVLFGGFAAPYLYALASSPAEWLAASVSLLLFILTSLQVVGEMFSVFARVLPSLLPPYAWMVFASALAGFSVLWTFSIWRFSRASQGVFA